MGQGRAVAGMRVLARAVDVVTRQGPDDVGSVPIIAMTRRVVPVQTVVEEDDFPMVIAKHANRRVGGVGLCVSARWTRSVSKACMIGINPAVCDTDNHT